MQAGASPLLFLFGALFAAPASAECTAIGDYEPTALQYICDGSRAWADSVASGDTTVLEQILSDDFIGVDPKGKQYRKAAMIQNTKEAPRYFKSNALNDVVVRFYGPVAVAQGSETWERQNGARGKFVWTDTWLNRNGRWQIIAAQDVIAPADEPR